MVAANRSALVGWLAVACILLAGGVWAGGARATESEEGAVSASFAVESYAQQCARCHGVAGQGGVVPDDGREAPALAGNPDVTVPYLDLVLRTGRMPPAGDPFDNRERHVLYDDAERAALVGWMAQEFDLEGVIPDVGEGDVARGLEVFARNCAHCHGNAGGGGTAGQRAFTPRVNNLSEVAVAEAIRVGPFEMPAFGEDVLSEHDVDSVVAYLEEVGAESGTPFLGLVELNPVFASGFVGLLALALLASLVYIGSRPVPLEQVVVGLADGPPDDEESARDDSAQDDQEEDPDGDG